MATPSPTGQPSSQPTGFPSAQPSSLPTGQPTSYPTSLPTSQPTPITIYVSEDIIIYGTLLFLFCLIVAVCCCHKGSGYKKKIYQMMDEAKIDVDDKDVGKEAEESSDEEDEESTVQMR